MEGTQLDILMLAALVSLTTAITMSYNETLGDNHSHQNTSYVTGVPHDVRPLSTRGPHNKTESSSNSTKIDLTTRPNLHHQEDHTKPPTKTKEEVHEKVDTGKDTTQPHHIRISNHLKPDKIAGGGGKKNTTTGDSVDKISITVKDTHAVSDKGDNGRRDNKLKENDLTRDVDIDHDLDDDLDEDFDEDGADDDIYDQMMNDFAPVSSKTSKTNNRRPRNKYRESKRSRKSEDNQDKAYSYEYRIKRDVLTHNYDKTSRPVRNDSTTVTASVGMSLFHILDTNEKMQTLSALIAIRVRWVDEYITWNASQYGGVDSIWVPAMHIWTPDIFINNFADDSFQDFMNTFAIIESSGTVLWMFPAVIKTYCTLDVQHFPFDQQKCDIVFISWTFNGLKVNMTYNETEHSAVYYKPKNQEWFVDRVEAKRHEKVYACCEEPYPDVTFTIHMTRRSLFYIINLIFPCLLIYTVSFLGFFLPAESGEKVNLEITILLALVVFLLMVGETLPPTPDAIPALGLLFGTTMIMVSIALVMAVIVTNLYLRKDSGKRVPFFVRKILLAKTGTLIGAPSRMTSVNSRKFSPAIHRNPPNAAGAAAMTNNHHPHENHHNCEITTKYTLQELELDNVSQLSDQETAICTNSKCRRRKSIRPFSRSSCDPEHKVIMAAEWTILATNVDRIFFWLFLFSSAAALITIFAKIPNFTALQ